MGTSSSTLLKKTLDALSPVTLLTKDNQTMFNFISTRPDEAIQNIKKALKHKIITQKKKNTIHFLDIGCGTGNILYLATAMASEAKKKIRTVGIEINPTFAAIANRTTKCYTKPYTQNKPIEQTAGSTIFNMDARNFKNYGQFDIIHFYEPMEEPGMESILGQIQKQCIKPQIIISEATHYSTKRLLKNKNIHLEKTETSNIYIIHPNTKHIYTFKGSFHQTTEEKTYHIQAKTQEQAYKKLQKQAPKTFTKSKFIEAY